MEKTIYLNRKINYHQMMNKHSHSSKVVIALVLFAFCIIIFTVKDINLFQSSSLNNQSKPNRTKRQEEEIQSTMSINQSLSSSCDDTIGVSHVNRTKLKNNKTIKLDPSKTLFSLTQEQEMYFWHCYLHLKQFELSLLYHLNRKQILTELLSTYSQSEVIKDNENYCSTGGKILLAFHNISQTSPKCIEIKGLFIKNNPNPHSIISLKLVSIIVRGNEIHLYELKRETIDAYALAQINDSQYMIIKNTLYHHRHSIRFCLSELEQSKFARMNNADKGIEFNLSDNNQNGFCFESIFFIF